jgi:hypothetical protein
MKMAANGRANTTMVTNTRSETIMGGENGRAEVSIALSVGSGQ